MQIKLNSVTVRDQDAALRFYTEVLGFLVKADRRNGGARWLTVVSPEEPDGTELVLQGANPDAAAYQQTLFDSGIPVTSFAVEDLAREYQRLQTLGVVFRTAPTEHGNAIVAVFEDTCGNLIQLFEER